MKHFHNIDITIFLSDSEPELLKDFKKIFPFDISKLLKSETVMGFDEKLITKYNVRISRQPRIREFMQNLLSNLSKQDIEKLISESDSRIDDSAHFFLRLSKASLSEDRLWLTESGKCLHIKCKVAAYPSNRENTKDLIVEYLESFLEENHKQ